MRQQLILTLCLAFVLCITLVIKLMYYPRLYGQTAYYFMSIFWICGILVLIFLLNIIWHWYSNKKSNPEEYKFTAWPNRRKTFRIIYPVFIRPTFILDAADNRPRRNLEFQIIDLSQEGCCFIDDGSLGTMEHFAGRIVFSNGDQNKVSGRLVRKKGDHVSVQFSRSLVWAALLAEQRRVMAHMRPVK